jgi:hypothetical protein
VPAIEAEADSVAAAMRRHRFLYAARHGLDSPNLIQDGGSLWVFAPREFEIEGYTAADIGYHVWLLGDAGLMSLLTIPTPRKQSLLISRGKATILSVSHATTPFGHMQRRRQKRRWLSESGCVSNNCWTRSSGISWEFDLPAPVRSST